MTAMICTCIFFAIVGGAAMAMIAVNEYYERKADKYEVENELCQN